jgi:hypothetical protein
MASRNRFIINLHLIGAACSAALAAVTAGILVAVCPPIDSSLLANPGADRRQTAAEPSAEADR